MQMSQTMSLEEARQFMFRASRLVNDGMVLEHRHYDTLKQVFQMWAHAFLNEKWFSEWVGVHREYLVIYFAPRPGSTSAESIAEYVVRKDAERLQRMLRRLKQ